MSASGDSGGPRPVRGNLPSSLSSFVGREQELREVRRLLASRRLLTLTGAGGSGKTRLALEAAGSEQREAIDPAPSFRTEAGAEGRAAAGPLPPQSAVLSRQSFPEGVWLVELAPLGELGYVAPALAAVLGVREQPSQPLLETLAAFLESKQLLLLLDNCEHLLDACATLVQQLLQRAPRVRVLATSREPLGVPGETVWQVRPLSLPVKGSRGQGTATRDDGSGSSSSLSLTCERGPGGGRTGPHSVLSPQSSDAVRLFVERAQERLAGFELNDANATDVVRICERLDGLPLALELAAAWIGVLSVEQIAARLDNALSLLVTGVRTAPARQQTLRATLDWSYALLDAPEQALLRRLSVFAGPFALDGIEAVAGEAVAEVLAALRRLVAASLVVAEDSAVGQRYRLLETVRGYGRESLLASGDAAAALRRHGEHYCALAEEAEPRLGQAEQHRWLERLQAEYENLRAALAWSLSDDGELRLGLRIGGALRQFWELHGQWSEGLRWLEELMERSGANHNAPRAMVLVAAGVLASRQSAFPQAEAYAREALGLFEELGEEPGQALALNTLGLIAYGRADTPAARRWWQASVDLRRRLGDLHGAAIGLSNLGTVCWAEGDYAGARALLKESLALQRRHGGPPGTLALVLLGLGNAALALGEYVEARACFQQSLPIARAVNNQYLVAHSLLNSGQVAFAEGDLATAEELLEAGLEVARAINWREGVALIFDRLARIACHRADYRQARALLHESLRLRRTDTVQRWLAEALASFAMLAAEQGQTLRAARLFTAAEGLEEQLTSQRLPLYRADRERAWAMVRAALPGPELAEARTQGQAMGTDEAVAYALGERPEFDAPARMRSAFNSAPSVLAAAAPPAGRSRLVGPAELTAREATVLRLIAAGKSNKMIARELSVSVRTVEYHITSLYQKIDVQSKAEATAYALRNHLDQPAE